MNIKKKQIDIRQQVWNDLRKVALPDSRFHFDFEEFIPDFIGSDFAMERLVELDIYKNSKVIFITPDNCLEKFRGQALKDNKILLISTYGMRRGFIRISSKDVPKGLEDLAVLLDAMEKFGEQVSLSEIKQGQPIDLLVTGGSTVTKQGLRIGKGHGFFDLEWAMLYSISVVDENTPIVNLVHDCQIIDEQIEKKNYDTICDFIVTPTKIIQLFGSSKPDCGIVWDKLEPEMLIEIPLLQELKNIKKMS